MRKRIMAVDNIPGITDAFRLPGREAQSVRAVRALAGKGFFPPAAVPGENSKEP